MPKKKKSMVSVSSQSDFTSSQIDSEVSSMSPVSVKEQKAPKGRFQALVQKIKQDQKKNEKTGEDSKKKKTDKQTEKGKKPEGMKETETSEKIKEDTNSTIKKESKTGKKKIDDKKSKTKNDEKEKKKKKHPQKDKRTQKSTKDADSSQSYDDSEDMSPNNVTDAKNIDRRASSYDGITISIRKKYFLTPEDSDEDEDEGDKRRRSSWIGSFFIQLFLGLRSFQNTVIKMFRSKSIDSGHGVDAVSQSVVEASAKEVTIDADDASVSTVSTKRKKKKSKFRWFWRRKKKGKLRPRKIKKSRGLWRRLTSFMRKKSSVQEPGNVLSAAMT